MRFSIGTFEGPLDLLLALVRREEMDIMDIDLHTITQQYLEVVHDSSRPLNLEEGGEFIYMASLLMYMKSKSLLPQEAVPEQEEEILSKESLMKALVRHSEFLKAAEKLNQREVLNRDIWSCPGLSFAPTESEEIEVDGLFSLFKACRKALKRACAFQMTIVFPSTWEWIHHIRKHFVKGKDFSFQKLVGIGKEPMLHQILLSFLSLLELGKLGAVSLVQKGKDIRISTRKDLSEDIFYMLGKQKPLV